MQQAVRFIKNNLPLVWSIIEDVNSLLLKTFRRNEILRVNEAICRYPCPNGIVLIKLQESDIDRTSLFFQGLSAADTAYFKPFPFSRNSLLRVVTRGNYLIYGVMKNSALIGVFFLRLFANGKAFLGFAVSEEARGVGIGKLILSTLGMASETSCFRLYSSVSTQNIPSMKAHIAAGYKVTRVMKNGFAQLTWPRVVPLSAFLVRFFDVFFSGAAILMLVPFMLPIAFCLKFTGEHDIFYKQKRIGRFGTPFFVLKFATMLRNSPNLAGGLITTKNDPRILPMGNFLRKTKINELPQLINIFIGQMSIIGYRPFAEAHYNLYADEVKAKIKTIRPGLTGIGSVVFKNEEQMLHEVPDREYFHDKIITPYKGKLECWYVDNRSLAKYFLLILLTAWAFIKPNSRAVYRVFKDLPPCPPELTAYL